MEKKTSALLACLSTYTIFGLSFIFSNETYGIKMTSSSFAGIILGLVPVMGLLCGRLFLKEKASVFHAVCAVLSVFGVAFTTAGGEIRFSLPGTVLLLSATLSTTLFTVISRNISDSFSPFERSYIMFALGSAFFAITAFIENRKA